MQGAVPFPTAEGDCSPGSLTFSATLLPQSRKNLANKDLYPNADDSAQELREEVQ